MSAQQVVTELNTNAMAKAFSSSLFLPSSLEPNLEEALHHVLGNPGSLIRPSLVLQMATAYGLGLGDSPGISQ